MQEITNYALWLQHQHPGNSHPNPSGFHELRFGEIRLEALDIPVLRSETETRTGQTDGPMGSPTHVAVRTTIDGRVGYKGKTNARVLSVGCS